MIKKEIEVQIALLVLISGFFFGLTKINIVKDTFLYFALEHSKRYLLFISIILWVPLIINLGLQAFSKGNAYEEKKYYKILKVILHYSFFILLSIMLGIIFAYINLWLRGINQNILSNTISLIIYFILFLVIFIFFKKKFKINIFDAFSY